MQDYQIIRENDKLHIKDPLGRFLIFTADTQEQAEILIACHREKRLPTEEERRILYPEMYTPTTYPQRPRRATAVMFGNLVFVNRDQALPIQHTRALQTVQD